jgi:predicted permease
MSGGFAWILGPLLLGIVFQAQLRRFSGPLQKWVLWVALPSLVFEKLVRMPALRFDSLEFWILVGQPWLHFFIAGSSVIVIGRLLRWGPSITGALALTVALGNTSFVGIPLIRILQGEHALANAILLDQLGSFLILATVAAPLASACSPTSSSRLSFRAVLKRVLTFPSFVALLAAFAVRALDLALPDAFYSMLLASLGQTLAPAALLWVGIHLDWSALGSKRIQHPLLIGLFLKLFLFPLMTYALLRLPIWSSVPKETLKTVFLESAMGSMITAGVVAVDRGYDSRLAPLMVGVSIVISLISVPLWAWSF